MLTIHKYVFNPQDEVILQMPCGANIISCQNQFDTITIWALVDTSRPKEKRTLMVVPTGGEITRPIDGQPVNEDTAYLRFLGTVQLRNGALVYHVFDVTQYAQQPAEKGEG